MKKKLVIFGTGPSAEISNFYFTEDSDFEIEAFTVNETHKNLDSFQGKPVVAYEKLIEIYPPEEFFLFIGIGYSKLNQKKTELYLNAKSKGYRFATYIYSDVKIWLNNKIGENTFIFEDNTIQPFVEIGNNCILWSGNHLGHNSKIGDNCFITSHVVISGFDKIGNNCYIGVNATLKDSIKVADNCIIGAGAIILKDTKPYEIYPSDRTKPVNIKSSQISI